MTAFALVGFAGALDPGPGVFLARAIFNIYLQWIAAWKDQFQAETMRSSLLFSRHDVVGLSGAVCQLGQATLITFNHTSVPDCLSLSHLCPDPLFLAILITYLVRYRKCIVVIVMEKEYYVFASVSRTEKLNKETE